MKIPPLIALQPYTHSVQHNPDEMYLTKRKLRKKIQYQTELPAERKNRLRAA